MNTLICFLKLVLYHIQNSLVIFTLMLPYIVMLSIILVLTQVIYKLSCCICNKVCSMFNASDDNIK